MHCEQAQGLLDGYLDNALSTHETLAMQEHIKICKSCSAILAAYQQMRQTLRTEGRAPLPSDLAARVSAALNDVVRADSTAFFLGSDHSS
jgi:anti-sigma factor RsiW